jgi:hypothetical protein
MTWSVEQSLTSRIVRLKAYLPIGILLHVVPAALPQCKAQLSAIAMPLIHRQSSGPYRLFRRKDGGRIQISLVVAM